MTITLKDVKPWIWVHLTSYPDRLDKAGPTAFEVSHSPTGEVFTRDGSGRPSYRVSGKKRGEKWLNITIKE